MLEVALEGIGIRECHAVAEHASNEMHGVAMLIGRRPKCGLSPTLPPEVRPRGMPYQDKTHQDERDEGQLPSVYNPLIQQLHWHC